MLDTIHPSTIHNVNSNAPTKKKHKILVIEKLLKLLFLEYMYMIPFKEHLKSTNIHIPFLNSHCLDVVSKAKDTKYSGELRELW